MSMQKKAKKRLILSSAAIVLAAGLGVGGWLFWQYRNDQKTVEVQPVSYLSTSYWGDTAQSSGTITSDYIQELYPDSSKTITDVFVTEGQEVSIGDPLLQYDKTKLELDVEAKDVAIKETELKIDNAQNQLKKLQNTKPIATPKPEKATPTPKPTKPTPTPEPEPEPTPAPTPTPEPTTTPADVTLYSQLDVDAVPYAGSGTTDDPYIFLCTDDCTMTKGFLSLLFGLGTETEGDGGQESTDGEIADGDVTGEELTGGETGDGEITGDETGDGEDGGQEEESQSQLATPFAAIFEVREDNSNYGELIASFKLDGTQLSANFQNFPQFDGSQTVESVAEAFEARAKATPSPTPNPNNYDDMGYTSSQLKELIAEKRQEIKNYQYELKQNKLDLEKARLALKNSTVLSTVDGVVRTLTDLDTAAASNQPFLVVTGAEQYYVTGVLSEGLLGSVQPGDTVTVNSWENGMTYSAQVVSISDYPLEDGANYYYGTGNPNSSSYEFVAVLGAENDTSTLRNGMYVDLTLSVQEGVEADGGLYLDKAYLREDEGGSYVMKVSRENRLEKAYVSTGKTIYSGSYVEIRSGLTTEDYIAFPYGTDVKDGVRAVIQGTEEVPYPEDEPGYGVASGEDSAAADDSTDGVIAMDGGAAVYYNY